MLAKSLVDFAAVPGGNMLDQSFCCRLIDASIICYQIHNGSIPDTSDFYRNVGFASGCTPTVFADGEEEINAGAVARPHWGQNLK